MGIESRYAQVCKEVADEALRCGRDPQSVRVIAVSKTVDEAGVARAFEAGARDFGENRPDPLQQKQRAFPQARWHFIGNIQARRIPEIVVSATLIHSVCDMRHAEKIAEAAKRRGKVQDILLEVNVSGEESKSGVAPSELKELLLACEQLEGVCVRGLMTMAPQGDLAIAGEVFQELAARSRELRQALGDEAGLRFNELSMGMSEDWREAIAAGATMVRIGRAIFSDEFSG